MSPIRFIALALRVLLSERKRPDPEEAARVRRSVKNALRERRLRELSEEVRR